MAKNDTTLYRSVKCYLVNGSYYGQWNSLIGKSWCDSKQTPSR